MQGNALTMMNIIPAKTMNVLQRKKYRLQSRKNRHQVRRNIHERGELVVRAGQGVLDQSI